ncbi:MAG: trypsin-like serine protease [Chitinophagaceae bacterium]|nr:trypsin-like serine protease [Oligoflexus sp.]
MIVRWFFPIALSVSLGACSNASAPRSPIFGKAGSGNLSASATDGTTTTAISSTTPPVLGSSAIDTSSPKRETAPPISLNTLKETMSYVSPKVSCDPADLGIVGGVGALDDDLVTASTFRILFGNDHYCSAILIGKNQLVTAAHCFKGVTSNSSFEIGFGVNGIPTGFQAKQFALHPHFNQAIMDANVNTPTALEELADVAILSFEGELTSAMRPVRIADPNLIYGSMPVIVAGFGVTSTNDKSRRPLMWLVSSIMSINNHYNEFQLQTKTASGACFGDSGGPTFIVGQDAKCLQVIGSISGPTRGASTCDLGGGLSMDLTHYRNWIGCKSKEMGYTMPYLDTSFQNCHDRDH